MRVVLLDPSGQIGGAERVLLDCIQVDDGCPGASLSVVTLAAGPFADAVRALGARAVVVEAPATFSRVGDAFASTAMVMRSLLAAVLEFPGFFRHFSRAVSALAPQLIHSHGIKTHVLAALLPRRPPLVWHFHDYLGMRSLSARLLALLSRRCSLAIAVSESVAADARRCLPEHLRIVVVHNSVDCERFRPDGPALDLDTLCGLPPAAAGTIRIGLPATFARWKGHDVFLSAIAKLRRPDVRAYVIGGALYETANSQWSRDELSALVQAHGLDGQVGFTGLLEDMPSAYRALDVVVHASTRPEPFGLVIVEAMACGRAVIAAPEGGAGELFADGEQAIAVLSGDDGALAEALAKLIAAPAVRTELGARARTHVVRSFGRARFATDLQTALAPLHARSGSIAAT